MRIGPPGVLDGGAVADHPRVEGRDGVGRDQEGIDVELRDLRKIGGQVGQADEGLDELVHGRRGPAAVALQERPHAEPVEHAPGQPLVERGESDGPVPVDLGRGPAHAGQDDGAEGRVLLDAEDHLDPVLAPGSSFGR